MFNNKEPKLDDNLMAFFSSTAEEMSEAASAAADKSAKQVARILGVFHTELRRHRVPWKLRYALVSALYNQLTGPRPPEYK